MRAHFIFYVADQSQSTSFYRGVLMAEPSLDVPGMSEFELGDGAVLGLMPEAGIERLLGVSLRGPDDGARRIRAELYLLVNDPVAYHARALSHGAQELSAVAPRDWGHDVGYSVDPDGYVLAFARLTTA